MNILSGMIILIVAIGVGVLLAVPFFRVTIPSREKSGRMKKFVKKPLKRLKK